MQQLYFTAYEQKESIANSYYFPASTAACASYLRAIFSKFTVNNLKSLGE